MNRDMENENKGQTTGTSAGGARRSVRITRGRGAQESEEAGMEQMSRMLREARDEDEPGLQAGMDTDETGTEGDTDGYIWILTVQEYVVGERERGMCDRERGMSERERAMYDRECAMADRERAMGDQNQGRFGGMNQGESQGGMGR